MPFATANPQIEICVCKRPNRFPKVKGWYVQDRSKELSLKGLSRLQVVERIKLLRDSRPIAVRKWAKPFRTSESVQGPWEYGQLLDRPHQTIRA